MDSPRGKQALRHRPARRPTTLDDWMSHDRVQGRGGPGFHALTRSHSLTLYMYMNGTWLLGSVYEMGLQHFLASLGSVGVGPNLGPLTKLCRGSFSHP